ncbi:MarR family winged helix-turn-helix transcriptional regulator [Chryseobacterium phocaeense]|uniref:MarR family winged helix-turn-helix transcriptional regulator n=1 Tax=Chryseobacterium phocaeense TaxID=1816690 RepID=UPI0009BA585D|nr:MarR family transcriptional regulator [Chryseobacterium phocaeense]
MNKTQKDFYNAFTDLQCYILANMNKGSISGVTATHYNIIEFIYRHEGITGKQMAKAFGISQAAISKQLKFLLENKFIRQDQSSSDRRIFNLSVTGEGKFIVDNSENFRESVTVKFGKILSPGELKTFTELLNKALTHISEH